MIWTAWNNGAHQATGAGYGFKVDPSDRDREFMRTWQAVLIQLPSGDGFRTAEANVSKASFWSQSCGELISRDIGCWMLNEGYAPWPNDAPPKFEVESVGDRLFRVKRVLNRAVGATRPGGINWSDAGDAGGK